MWICWLEMVCEEAAENAQDWNAQHSNCMVMRNASNNWRIMRLKDIMTDGKTIMNNHQWWCPSTVLALKYIVNVWAVAVVIINSWGFTSWKHPRIIHCRYTAPQMKVLSKQSRTKQVPDNTQQSRTWRKIWTTLQPNVTNVGVSFTWYLAGDKFSAFTFMLEVTAENDRIWQNGIIVTFVGSTVMSGIGAQKV